jgi:MerR family transcriptional regulator, thiopeptide resistance regulator
MTEIRNPHADEARERWGNTEAYRQSQERTSRYTERDWAEIKAAGNDLNERLAAALRSGAAADSPAVMDLAEEHRQQLNRYFYDCGHEFHRGLADMYVDDPRFTATFDAVAPGLATYLREAIHANAARAQA